MQILLNDKNEIIAYAVVGGIEKGITIDDSVVPESFEDDFKPNYFVFKDNSISKNKGYVEKEVSEIIEPITETFGSDNELRAMFASMQMQIIQGNKMVMELAQQNAALSKQVTEIIKGSVE